MSVFGYEGYEYQFVLVGLIKKFQILKNPYYYVEDKGCNLLIRNFISGNNLIVVYLINEQIVMQLGKRRRKRSAQYEDVCESVQCALISTGNFYKI